MIRCVSASINDYFLRYDALRKKLFLDHANRHGNDDVAKVLQDLIEEEKKAKSNREQLDLCKRLKVIIVAWKTKIFFRMDFIAQTMSFFSSVAQV